MQPLAERLRPKNLDDYIGQKHLVGEGAVLRKAIESGNIPSIILWGPLTTRFFVGSGGKRNRHFGWCDYGESIF